MKKTITVVAFLALVAGTVMAETPTLQLSCDFQTASALSGFEPFAEIGGVPVSDSELASIVGGQTFISAPYNSRGDFDVEQRSDCYVERYTVRGTTRAESFSRTAPSYGDTGRYTPVALPDGRYLVSNDLTTGRFISGYQIYASVPTQLSNGDIVSMNVYFVHAIPCGNTYGCAGIQTSKRWGGSAANWGRVSQTISRETSQSWINIRDRD